MTIKMTPGITGTHANGETTITVEDLEGLEALPYGVRIEDAQGDEYVKVKTEGPDRYICTDEWTGEQRFNFQAETLLTYEPLEILNPEILGEFSTPETQTERLHGFAVGDEVMVRSTAYGRIAKPGDKGTVVAFNDPYLNTKLANDVVFPFQADEIEVVKKALPYEALKLTTEAELNALPDGSIVVDSTDPLNVRVKLSGHWRTPGQEGRFNYNAEALARQRGVLLMPSRVAA